MARKPFVVIDSEILSSSVWSEAAHVKLVWLTLLILCDTEGYVGAALPGIARAAGVTLEQAQEAMTRFQGPDEHSRTKTDQGRRVREVERGWLVLNFKEHLDRLSRERAKSRERMRRHREKKRAERHGYVTVTAGNREQGIGNRDNGGRKDGERPPLPPPPEQRAEDATKKTIHGLQLTLARKLTDLEEHPNSRQSLTAWCREVSSYDRADGTKVRGVADYRTIQSIERLERSISDADWWMGELNGGRVVGDPALVEAARGQK